MEWIVMNCMESRGEETKWSELHWDEWCSDVMGWDGMGWDGVGRRGVEGGGGGCGGVQSKKKERAERGSECINSYCDIISAIVVETLLMLYIYLLLV